MTFETLLFEKHGPVATVTINRPKALNALNPTVIDELTHLFGALAADREVRAAILTGAGDRAFVAGADITAMAALGPAEALLLAEKGHRLCDRLSRLPQPVIAAVNGFALGGGTELALACDLIYASSKAKFGQPEVNIGVMPGFGGTQRLPRRVGLGRAAEMIFTGEPIGAEEALRLGLVNAVVAPEDLLPRARAVAEKIAQRAPHAVAMSKRALYEGQEMPLSQANALERRLFADLFATADQKEGMQAFLEKRPATFTGK
jgi:enoyl-CoA hydratase